MTTEYNILLDKLNIFIKKYYKNKLLKGLLFALFIYIASYFFAVLSEYFGNFSTTTRTIIFSTIIALYVYVFLRYILIPLLGLFKIGKILTHKQAAKIISDHFNGISDKFINVLELAEIKQNENYSQQLVLASINNKISKIKVFNFEKAINVKNTYKYFTYFFTALVITLLTYLIYPEIINNGSDRLLHFTTFYKQQSPFNFILQNDTLAIEQGNDFNLTVKVNGKYVPDRVYVVVGNNNIMLEKVSKTEFKYSFKSVNNSFNFKFNADNYYSSEYKLTVLPPAVIQGFNVEIIVPQYTGLKNSLIENTGDFTVPCGSIVKWTFNTLNISNLTFLLNDTTKTELQNADNQFTKTLKLLNTTEYSIKIQNKNSESKKDQPVKYSINVIPDLYPTVSCDFISDTNQVGQYYFKGEINDDYGFKKLTFNYKSLNSSDSLHSVILPVNNGLKYQEFYFSFNFSNIKYSDGDIEYYFEVFDNDAVHGSKSSRSAIKSFKIPSEKEVEKYRENENKKLESQLKDTKKLSEEIKRDIKKLQENLLNSKTNSWEQTKKLQDIVEKQNQLEQLIKQLNSENKLKNNYLNTFTEQDKQLLDKQKQIEDLLENVMDDEMKKLMDEIKKLMENFDQNKLNNLSEQLKLNYNDLNKQLDRNLEMLKRLDVEEKLNNITKELDKLSEQQDKLSEQSVEKNNNIDSLKNEQKQNEQNFKDLMDQYNKLEQKNKELTEPYDLKQFEQEKNEINEEFNKSQESLNQNNRKNASKSQKKNSQQIKQMSQKMQDQLNQEQMEQESEDAENLKQIIDNLEKFSFNTEALMKQTTNNYNSPDYLKNVEKQKVLNSDFNIIKDSLYALANRSPMLGSEINSKIKKIITLNSQILENFDSHNAPSAKMNQQYNMTYANDLALLLGEVLEQMQKQSQQQCNGGKCKKPGSGKPNLSQMKDMQKSLKSQMQSMIDQLKKGEGKKDGKSLNEQIGKMITLQDKFNQMLNQLMQSSGISPEMAKQLNEIKSMVNDVEKDIVNKKITPQTMLRQEQILTRMLEAEKSDRERETENKRESNEGKNNKISNPEQIFKYKGLNSHYNELLEGTKIKLTNYYNNKYKEYLIHLNQQ